MPGTGKDWRLGEQGYSIVSLPLRRPSDEGMMRLQVRQVLGMDLNCSESTGRQYAHWIPAALQQAPAALRRSVPAEVGFGSHSVIRRCGLNVRIAQKRTGWAIL